MSAKLLSADRKFTFRGQTHNDQVLWVAGDKKSGVRQWLEEWVPEDNKRRDDLEE
jgi:hypothetical protein